MPEVTRLGTAPPGCRWRATTAGDYDQRPDRVYKAAWEGAHAGNAYWKLVTPSGSPCGSVPVPASMPNAMPGSVAPPDDRNPRLPPPTRRREIRVSGVPGPIVIYGSFSQVVEAALVDRWLSRYEMMFLRDQIGGPNPHRSVDHPLDLLAILRQRWFHDGYRPPHTAVDDFWNLGLYSEATKPAIIGTYQDLATRAAPNVFRFYFEHCQRDWSRAAFSGPQLARMLAVRVGKIASHGDLAPDDRWMLIALQVAHLVRALTPSETLTINLPGCDPYVLGAMTAVQRADWDNLSVGAFGKGNAGVNRLVQYRRPLSKVLQGVLMPAFDAAKRVPPGWQWPIVP